MKGVSSEPPYIITSGAFCKKSSRCPHAVGMLQNVSTAPIANLRSWSSFLGGSFPFFLGIFLDQTASSTCWH
jgi:hypothetical protein